MERETPKKERGLYEKFRVTRTDGTDAPGEKHHGCDYFVLDLTHDWHAEAALRAYAKSCKADYPALAKDLRRKANEIGMARIAYCDPERR